MNPLLKRKTSSSSLSKKSETSDGSAREGKNPAARSRLYEKTLAEAGIYMGGGPGITDTCRDLCKSKSSARIHFLQASFLHGLSMDPSITPLLN
jgi:hypothetical protein